jgi:HK97 family phage major capsid protein
MTKEQIAAMNARVTELQAKDAGSLTAEEVTFLTDSTRIANSLMAQRNAGKITIETELLASPEQASVGFSIPALRKYWKNGDKSVLTDEVRINNALTAGADFVLLSKVSDVSLRKAVPAKAGLVDYFDAIKEVRAGQTICQVMGDDNITISYGGETGSAESNVWTGSLTHTAKEVAAKGAVTDKLLYGSDAEFSADFSSQYTNKMRKGMNTLFWSGAGDSLQLAGIASAVAETGTVASASVNFSSASYAASGQLVVSGSVGQISRAIAAGVKQMGDFATNVAVFVSDAAHAVISADVDTIGNQSSLSRDYANGTGTILGLPVVRANVSGGTAGTAFIVLLNPDFYKVTAFTDGVLFKAIETTAGVDRVFKTWIDAKLARGEAAFIIKSALL